jgi:hypothetical protein
MKIPFTQPILESAFTEPFHAVIRVSFALKNTVSKSDHEARERFVARITPGLSLGRVGNNTQVVKAEIVTSEIQWALCITYVEAATPLARSAPSGWALRAQDDKEVYIGALFASATITELEELT